MCNGEVDARGLTAALVRPVGSLGEFGCALKQSGLGAVLRSVRPGEPVWLGGRD
jgi:hypothetical protein